MSISRRTFPKATGTLFPATLRAATDADLIQQQRLKMEIQRIGSKASVKGPAEYFTGTVRVDPYSKQTLHRERAVEVLRSNRVLAPPGIPIHWVRFSSSQLVAVGYSERAVPSKRFIPAI
jgi:hypothetical protein